MLSLILFSLTDDEDRDEWDDDLLNDPDIYVEEPETGNDLENINEMCKLCKNTSTTVVK